MTDSRGSREEFSRRPAPLLVCVGLYLLAAAVGIAVASIVFRAASDNPLVSSSIAAAAVGDVAATLVVFIFSVIFDNSSLYDPYWSVIPPFLAAFWLLMGIRTGSNITFAGVVVILMLLVWAGRLTLNWARGWRGFDHEDWRYAEYRQTAGRAYWLVSFLGFHLFPTILVFLGCLSLIPVLSEPQSRFDGMWVVAVVVIAAAIYIEARADRELYEFKGSGHEAGEILDTGIWSYSRHPNYFGEVLFWWGLYLAGLAANSSFWWTMVGPLAITALFLFVSVPMMERHMTARYPDYATRSNERSRFVPWFRR